ncbi:putative mitochondrial presequence protease protein [Neofusicoccum parvum UCRNP2]|uniref:Presequence protease, mitochondrial n=1 Tax=Botryosphaeria parva (strain UCR-NP2) TaxID=1287680 RepID=R1ES01_BOTPV|nr:putative mitochondrial presequence protease protein [Neofusicoccum parvum UCRNP2]
MKSAAALVIARLLFIDFFAMLRASSRPALLAARTHAPFLRVSAAAGAPARGLASVTDLQKYPKVGSQLHGFTLRRAKHVPELELTAIHLQHDQTGADYLHVARDDSNNVFSIGFKTNPPDDTGVPHILEHTTLYPVRDPFFKMLPRSLSNFMNAFTSSDHTTYPFATTNPQDFKNLMSVYLDATLHPLLKANDFTQEGWRIGPENPLEPASKDNQLAFKGVVYNEMKGQMSDASYLYYIRFQDHIFPDINNSGGDPQKITDLTHEQLRKFHADHYHPSNAKVFTYGDMPLDEHLKEIGTQLEKFNKIRVDTDIKAPIDLASGPKNVTVTGPIDPLVPADMQYKTSTSWLMCDSSDILETFSLGVLSSLLLDGYGSPLYRGLIETGLGPDWSPNTGYDGSGKTGLFSVGLNGVKKDDVPKVKEAIFRTLAEVKEKGFSQTKVDGILHQLEIGLKHKTAHFGMGLMQRLKPGWFNGVDPFDALAWNETVDAFKAEYAKGGYLESLLEKYLLKDNTFTFTMEPSETYAQEIAKEESHRLASKILETTKNFGTEEEAHKFLEQRELELLEEQEKGRKQDLSCLPTVHVKDIPRQKDKKAIRDSQVGDVKVQWREAPTNGLTYFRAVNVFENLPDELREMIPLFSDALMRLGTKNQTMEQLEELIKLKTGGLTIGYHSTPSPKNIQGYEEGLAFAGSALDRNVPAIAKSFFPLPYQVYYSGLSIPTVPYVSASGAPLQILAQLLTHKHLHHEIREKGGAYGGGAYANGLGGIFGFYSYRDPNPQNTIKIINESGVWARDREWSDKDIEEAKLSVFQSLDAPESVSQEGEKKEWVKSDWQVNDLHMAEQVQEIVAEATGAA